MGLRVARVKKFAAVFLLAGLTGCKFGPVINKMAPDLIRDSKGYFEELRQRRVDQILQSFDPRADKDQLRSDIGNVIALVPQDVPMSVEAIGVSGSCKGTGVCTKHAILEYKYPDHWVLFQVTTSNGSGSYAITDLAVTPESAPVASLSRFTLRGKGWVHYLILLWALVSAGLALYALVLCVRTPMRKRKWLWIIAILLGIGEFGIEWSSGEMWYKIAHISLLPAGFGYNIDSPFITASIPAGAILFLLFRNRLRRVDAAALPIDPDVSTTVADQAESAPGQ